MPVYSVESEAEAHRLLQFACGTDPAGQFIARELLAEQTIPNLFAFGLRLANAHQVLKHNDAEKEKLVRKPTKKRTKKTAV